MPDARLDRTRPTLPEGYQFGDANPMTRIARLMKKYPLPNVHKVYRDYREWTAKQHWNVIEGEH